MRPPTCFHCSASSRRSAVSTVRPTIPPTGTSRVVVLGDGAWREWFGGAADVIGRTVTLNDERFDIIGVAPRGFTGPQLGRVDLWVPGHVLAARSGPNFQTDWNSQWLQIIARLGAGRHVRPGRR